MPNVKIGRNARVRKAIVNTDVTVPESAVIGFDSETDRQQGFTVTEGGITVVG
jgi:glucose-1-phosphate adenylyltransferase